MADRSLAYKRGILIDKFTSRTGKSKYAGKSGKLFQKRGEFVRHRASFLRRDVVGNNRFAERGEMVAEHIFLDAPQSVNDCRYLINDVETVAFRVNHFHQTANLSFDAAQTRQLSFVIDFDAAVRGAV